MIFNFYTFGEVSKIIYTKLITRKLQNNLEDYLHEFENYKIILVNLEQLQFLLLQLALF